MTAIIPPARLKICFFASLSESLGVKALELESCEGETLVALKKRLLTRGEQWQVLADTSILCALNYEMVNGNPVLQSGDEVAFFPPVTGG
ncbi:MAG: MoaD/ThiS family protein [Marinagarivorans sp.]|nr:MoaD/ThiS family protein [Marinagarivorans sp.]